VHDAGHYESHEPSEENGKGSFGAWGEALALVIGLMEEGVAKKAQASHDAADAEYQQQHHKRVRGVFGLNDNPPVSLIQISD
jgi:hypothetical protein